jgi:hypothetical protein
MVIHPEPAPFFEVPITNMATTDCVG